MSAQIIPISKSVAIGDSIETVNARDLHAFLEVGKRYTTWIQDRIAQYGFEEHTDYIVIASQNGEAIRGGHNRTDYHISLDMAKELSMVERNAKGKEARQYFIECERRARESGPALPNFADPAAAARAWAEQHERAAIAEQKAQAYEADHDALERIAMADGSLTITSAAKLLQMRPKDLFSWLRQNRWIYRRTGGGADLGYQDKVQTGYLEHKVTTVNRSDGSEKVTEQVRVTPKGVAVLSKRINSMAAPLAPLAGQPCAHGSRNGA